MKRILFFFLLVSATTANAQTISADRVIARQGVYLKDSWIDSVKKDTVGMEGSTRTVPTSDLVDRMIKGISEYPVFEKTRYLPDWGEGEWMHARWEFIDTSEDLVTKFISEYYSGGVLSDQATIKFSSFGLEIGVKYDETHYSVYNFYENQKTALIKQDNYTANSNLSYSNFSFNIAKDDAKTAQISGNVGSVLPDEPVVEIWATKNQFDGSTGNKVRFWTDSTTATKPFYFNAGIQVIGQAVADTLFANHLNLNNRISLRADTSAIYFFNKNGNGFLQGFINQHGLNGMAVTSNYSLTLRAKIGGTNSIIFAGWNDVTNLSTEYGRFNQNGIFLVNLASTTESVNKVQVGGPVKATRYNISEVFTPTGSADASGIEGDITRDATNLYLRTATGWLKFTGITF